MKKKNNTRTEVQIKKSKIQGLKTRVKNQCAMDKAGLKAVEYQLEFLKNNPSTQLPVKELNHSETVEAFESGIAAYKNSLQK